MLATRGLRASVFARVPVIELWTAKRVLDQGVTGVVFPFASNRDLAQRAAQACPVSSRRTAWFRSGSRRKDLASTRFLLRLRRCKYLCGGDD